MALREILLLPDPMLRVVSAPVMVNSALRKLANDMFETMYDAPGIGLAAIQIGVPQRLFVLDLARKEEVSKPIAFINPVITKMSEELTPYEEGCLSIPEYFAEVMRPAKISVNYHDLDGKPQTLEAEGLLATCIQHEMDHLNGVLFIDYLSRLRRTRVITKFTKIAREEGKL